MAQNPAGLELGPEPYYHIRGHGSPGSGGGDAVAWGRDGARAVYITVLISHITGWELAAIV